MNNIIQTIRHTARAATVLLLALLAVQTAGAQTNVSTVSGFAAAFDDPTVSVVNVTDDITGVGDLPPLNHDLTINLNGHTISGDGLLIYVVTDGSLTIYGEGDGGSVGNITSGHAGETAIYNDGTVTLSHVNITTNSEYAIGGPGTLYIGNNVSFNGWTAMPFSTRNVIIEGGYYNYDPENYNPRANVVATVTVGGVTHYFENRDIADDYINNNADKVDFSWSESDDTYTIHTATGWDLFCSLLANSDKGFFTGKTVRLGADIGTADAPVTRMAGASGKDFTGTFDGQGHTLTVGYGTADAPFGEQYAAPFRNLEDGCTIKNLHVAGHIYTAAKYAAGLAGDQYGDVTIQNCRSSVTIVSSVENTNNDGTHGGFIAYFGGKHKHLSFEGCLFDGKLLTTNGISHCGGFVGWANGVSGTTDTEVTFTNCLYAPAAIADADGEDEVGTSESATFARKNNNNNTVTLTITNSYYTRALGTAQGKALHSVTADDDVTLALSGTATEYTVSGITAYEGNQGIKYGTTYYAGSDDEVRLTLSNTATGDVPEGYSYGYTVSAGTLIGSTLTMPEEDVTVSLNTALRSTGQSVEVTYVDADGTTWTHVAIALDGTESDLAAGWYFVGLPTVAFDHTLYLNGNVQLILADGCTMNVTTSNNNGIDVDGSLTIYGQTDGTGTLNATSKYNAGIFTGSGTITISGGRVTATGDNETGISTDRGTITISGGRVTATGDNGNGIHTNSGYITISGGRVTATGRYGIYTKLGYITISGGRVTATGGNNGIRSDSGNITISGGRVTATGGYGIYTNSGTITLGCTTASDFIYASSYHVGPYGMNIADGQTLFDENGRSYMGNGVTIPTGKTLRRSPGIALTAHQAPDGNFWTTYYNGTRGFTIDDDENACAYTAKYGGDKLTLQKLGKQIPAGTAVIIVAENDVVSMATATDLDDFTGDNDLSGVNTDTPTSTLGTGTFYVLGMTTVVGEQHFGFHRYTGSMMAAHKAYVLVSNGQALARSLTMVFDEATGIESAEADSSLFTLHSSLSSWFTLDGRRLQAKPTAPGIYVNNGRKVVIK